LIAGWNAGFYKPVFRHGAGREPAP
jgi:hypothetical protein